MSKERDIDWLPFFNLAFQALAEELPEASDEDRKLLMDWNLTLAPPNLSHMRSLFLHAIAKQPDRWNEPSIFTSIAIQKEDCDQREWHLMKMKVSIMALANQIRRYNPELLICLKTTTTT